MVSSRLLDTLQPRPPTPPRNLDADIDAALDFLDDSFETERALRFIPPKASVETPQQTPQSSVEQPSSSSAKQAKKVNFSPWTDYNKAARAPKPVEYASSVQALPPSRELKPRKSILKPRASLSSPASKVPGSTISPEKPLSAHHFNSFTDMLEAVLHQLASEQRDYKQDAYITLLGTLRAYKNIPDISALKTKLDLLCQIILRDMFAPNNSISAPGTNMLVHACKLLGALMRLPSLEGCFDDDFYSAVLRKSIITLEDHSTPKAAVSQFLFLLTEQKFPARVFTVERAQRLLDLLQGIERRIRNNGIVGLRLVIYQRLVEQIPDLMVLRISEWLEDLCHGMLSSIPEIRCRAIDAATNIGILLGGNLDASKALVNLFNKESEDEPSYGDYFGKRLLAMLSQGTKSAANAEPDHLQERDVPKICAAVVLFLRSQRSKLDHWRHMKLWVDVFQHCFNSPDLDTKFQTSIAWNRLVYTVMPTKDTTPGIVNLLRRPLLSQVSRDGRGKDHRARRKYTLGSYCNLLYYSFRPAASSVDWTFLWTEYVETILGQLSSKPNSDADYACKILMGLFGGFENKFWNENRAHQTPLLVSAEELPALDTKWIRQQTGVILQLVKRVLKNAQWNLDAETFEKAPVCQMWRALITAIAEAGSKEIQATKELKGAIADFTGFFHDIWMQRKDSLGSQTQFIIRFSFLLRTTVHKLGPTHFSDQRLKKTAQSHFEVAPTPSQSNRGSGSPDSPLGHLLTLLITTQDMDDAAQVRALARTLMQSCLESKNGRHVQRELLGGCAATLDNHGALNLPMARTIWVDLAEMATRKLMDFSGPVSPIPVGGSQQLERGYRMLRQVVQAGCHLSSETDQDIARDFLGVFKDVIKREMGPGGITLVLTDHLYKDIQTRVKSQPEENLGYILSFAAIPLAWLDLNAPLRETKLAWKMLHTDSPKTRWSNDFNPFEQIFQTIALLLERIHSLRTLPTASVTLFFANLEIFLKNIPQHLRALCVKEVQTSFALWLRDPENCLDPTLRCVKQSVSSLHSALLDIIQNLPSHNSTVLASYREFFTACFMSRRKSIVIRTAKAWNLSFGQTDRLEYPAELARAIRRWQRTQDLDMSLPAFPESPQDMDMCMPDMYSSGSELNVDEQPEIQRPPIIPPSRRIRSLSPGLALRSPLPAPRHALPRSSNATPRAKLRHEDSQIQFEPIHSSPPSIDDAQESQNLTEHQKEVTERQHLDATSLYSDLNTSSPASILRSSPAKANKLRRKPAMTSSGSMNAKLRSSSSDENHEELDRPSTPQLAPPDIGMSDDLPGSSPTPSVPSAAPRPGSSSTHVATPIAVRQLVLDQEIFDPPSSPPKASEEADVVPDQDQQEEPRIDEIQVEGHEEQQDDLDVTEVPDIGAEEVLVNDIAETSNFETAVEAPDNSAFVDAQIQATDFAAEKQQHIDEALPNQTESHQDAGAQTTGVIHSVGAPTEALDEGGSIQVPVEEDSSGLFSDTPSSELPAAQLAAEYQEYVERRRSQVEASQNEASTHKDISELFPTIGTAQSETAPTEKADVTNPDDVEGQQEVAYDADSHIDVPATAENRREDGEEEMSVEEAVKVLDSFYAPADDDERDEDDEVDDGGDLKGDVSFVSASSKTTGTGTKRKATPGTRRQPRKVAKIQMKRSPILRRGTPSETSSVVSAKVYRSPIGDVKFYNPDGPDVRDCIVVALPGSKRGKGRPKRSRKSQNASENAETGPPAGATSRVESTYGRGNLQRRSSSRLSRTSASPEQDPTDQLRPIPNPVRRSTSNLSAVSSVPVQNTENAVSPAPKRGRQGRRSQTSEASGQVDNKALADTRVQVEDTPAQPPVSKKRRIEAAVEDSPQPESQTTGRRGRPRRVFSHVQVHSQGENANFDTTGQFEDAVESQPRGNAIDRTIIPATKDHPVESKREQEANIIPATEVQIAEDATTTEQPSPNPIATPRKRKREASMAEPHMTGASLEVPTESGTKTPTQLESQSATPARSPMREILTPSGILRGLKKILSDCKEAVLGSQEEREMDDVLFEIRKEVYEAGKRRKEGGET